MFYYFSALTRATMQKIFLICILLAFLCPATADSICDQIIQPGTQQNVMKHYVEFSFTMFAATDSIAPYFDGRALDRNGNHVTNYFSNDTMRKSLVESHMKYYAQLFNCSDSEFSDGYHGPAMAEAHAHLFIDRSLFTQYQQLSLQYLSVASFNPLSLRQLMNLSKLFEEHRIANTSNEICNEADCQEAVLLIDKLGDMVPYYINIEQGQDITIANRFYAKGYDFVLSGSDLCTAVSPIVHVDALTNVTTSILANLTGGDYYLGTWPRASCNLDTHPKGKIVAQIHVPSVEAPFNVPIDPPVDSTPINAPIESPVQSPVESPVEAPIQAPVTDDRPPALMPLVVILSFVAGILIIVIIVLLYKLKHKQPQYYDTIQ